MDDVTRYLVRRGLDGPYVVDEVRKDDTLICEMNDRAYLYFLPTMRDAHGRWEAR